MHTPRDLCGAGTTNITYNIQCMELNGTACAHEQTTGRVTSWNSWHRFECSNDSHWKLLFKPIVISKVITIQCGFSSFAENPVNFSEAIPAYRESVFQVPLSGFMNYGSQRNNKIRQCHQFEQPPIQDNRGFRRQVFGVSRWFLWNIFVAMLWSRFEFRFWVFGFLYAKYRFFQSPIWSQRMAKKNCPQPQKTTNELL